MITVSEVEEVHHMVIDMHGGSHGIRDRAGIESALARPFHTFDNKELYSSVLEKAASLIESILMNQPFVDGNKRTGYVIMALFLDKRNFDLIATENEKYYFVVDIASGNLDFDGIVSWLKANTQAK